MRYVTSLLPSGVIQGYYDQILMDYYLKLTQNKQTQHFNCNKKIIARKTTNQVLKEHLELKKNAKLDTFSKILEINKKAK